MKSNGFVAVVSSPSGAGRTSILRAMLNRFYLTGQGVLQRDKRLTYSVSVTTRPKRPGETEGKDYLFISEEEFKNKIERGEFIEWAEVHGFLYGTLREPLTDAIKKGEIVILDIDIQGAMQIKKALPECVMIFIAPPSLRSLEERLRNRGTDSEELIRRKLQDAHHELASIPEYDYLIVNEELNAAVGQLEAILEAEACRTNRAKYSFDSRSGVLSDSRSTP